MAGWSVITLHRLLIHHDQDAKHACSVGYDPHSAHIHDETYANDHCAFCAFVLSTPELLSVSAVLTAPVIVPGTKDTFLCHPSRAGTLHDTTCLRGPPSLKKLRQASPPVL